VKLFLKESGLYRVKRGQTLKDLSRVFCCPERLIVLQNGLTQELWEGQVVSIPHCEGNLYTVCGGESKTLLCGSPEAFRQKNGTDCLYPMQIVVL